MYDAGTDEVQSSELGGGVIMEERFNGKETDRQAPCARLSPEEEEVAEERDPVDEQDDEIPPATEKPTSRMKEGEEEEVEEEEAEDKDEEEDEEDKDEEEDKEDEDEEKEAEEDEEEGDRDLTIEVESERGHNPPPGHQVTGTTKMSGVDEGGQDDDETGRTKTRKRGFWENNEIRTPKKRKMKHRENATTKTPKIRPKKAKKRKAKTPWVSRGTISLDNDVQDDEVQQWPGPLPIDIDADSKEWFFTEAIITLDIDENPAKVEEETAWRMADAMGNWYQYKPAVHASISLAQVVLFTEYSSIACADNGFTQSL